MLLFDRVKETTTTTGTGDITLAGAVSKFRAFGDVLANNDTAYYVIEHQSAAEWEVGYCAWLTGGTLDRSAATILASSNSGNAVNFSAGTKHVWLDAPARALKPKETFLGAAISYGNNTFYPVVGTVAAGTATAQSPKVARPLRGSGRMKSLYLVFDVDPQGDTFTVFKNGSATALTKAVNGATTGEIVADVTFVDKDLVEVKSTNQQGWATHCAWAIEVEYDS